MDAGRLMQLTDFAQPLVAAATPLEPRELTVQGKNGNDVHGWVFVPKGAGPHPVLLNIHGGPFSNFDWSFFDEATGLCSRRVRGRAVQSPWLRLLRAGAWAGHQRADGYG